MKFVGPMTSGIAGRHCITVCTVQSKTIQSYKGGRRNPGTEKYYSCEKKVENLYNLYNKTVGDDLSIKVAFSSWSGDVIPRQGVVMEFSVHKLCGRCIEACKNRPKLKQS